ncbi:MAG TPA: glycosyltransferase family 2 protein [Candidatus Saccharimonadales bacterium]|jgi:cellulose synthase/poly-beta-1,6-N-acetylglucosamine synthase-like glycosyltransferase|nr:glycosyltransferase family 2 protein [Candidatus Saccharimonadales bacterium]
MKKSPLLYLIIFSVWVSLIAVTLVPLWIEVQRSEQSGPMITALVISSTLFIAYFWLNGTKDIVYTFYYYARRRSLLKVPPIKIWREEFGDYQPLVLLLHCACDDFNGDDLRRSMQQNYANTKTVILDDSKQAESRAEIDDFARAHNVEVVRRNNSIGFKAGNLNNFLQQATFDYFVILDSDEIIPPYFIQRALDYFARYENIGILQANHVATRNKNNFMNLFAIGVNSHWLTYQAVKHHHGFLSLLGHGAMISRECYQTAGGFPHLVAEDLCFSIEARNKGYYTAFAPDIICQEEYPVNYLAFKKRHSKWTQGNMEFIKKYTWRILTSKMSWFEKMDIFLFTYNLPLTAFFALYVVINVVMLPVLDYNVAYPTWLLVPTILFLLAPMLNDIVYYCKHMNPLNLVWYLCHTLLLYGSVFFVSLKSSLKSVFNKSVFLVTPKSQRHISRWEALTANKGELLFAVMLFAVSTYINHSPLPTLLIIIPAVSSVYLTLISNKSRRLQKSAS